MQPRDLFKKMLAFYGSQNWWPGEGFEIAIGAILTQNTSWKNVEKALLQLKKANCLNIDCLKKIPIEKLEELIRSSGYYRVKARRLKNLIELLSSLMMLASLSLLIIPGTLTGIFTSKFPPNKLSILYTPLK